MIYNLSAQVTISIYTQVEAKSLDEAILLSEKRNIEQTEFESETQELSAWVYDEIDGLPKNIKETEE